MNLFSGTPLNKIAVVTVALAAAAALAAALEWWGKRQKGDLFQRSYIEGEPCPKCGFGLLRREGMFYWRGDEFPAAFCEPCHSMWVYRGEEMPPLRPKRRPLTSLWVILIVSGVVAVLVFALAR